MATLHTLKQTAAIAATPVVVMEPQDLGEMLVKAVTVNNDGTHPLTDCKVQTGPTSAGPWFDEDISATGLTTLAGGAAGRWGITHGHRYLRVLATAAVTPNTTTVTVWLDALG